MNGWLAIAALGFFLGMRHATDPDHVVAVTTIVARQRSVKGSAVIGAVWGVGHTLTILVVGGGIILFNWVVSPAAGLAMELAVGVMLVILGVANLAGPARRLEDAIEADPHGQEGDGPHGHLHVHAHSHGDYVHTHVHAHDPDRHPHAPDRTPLAVIDRRLGAFGAYRIVRPLVVGIVHGLAGSAAVALLVLTTIRDPRWGLLYLLDFGVGTIGGMMLITALISVPFALSRGRSVRLMRGLRVASGVISLAFGVFVAYQIVVVNGLFTAHPRWVPR